jgi:hypothetical protein
VTPEASTAYEGLARAWASGPSRVYDRRADEVVAVAAVTLDPQPLRPVVLIMSSRVRA